MIGFSKWDLLGNFSKSIMKPASLQLPRPAIVTLPSTINFGLTLAQIHFGALERDLDLCLCPFWPPNRPICPLYSILGFTPPNDVLGRGNRDRPIWHGGPIRELLGRGFRGRPIVGQGMGRVAGRGFGPRKAGKGVGVVGFRGEG